MIMSVCVHALNQSLASVEASAVFASSQKAHILTPILASSVQGKPINSNNFEKSTFPARMCGKQTRLKCWQLILDMIFHMDPDESARCLAHVHFVPVS